MNADIELLRRYVDERSDAAFAELVRLHLGLVYSAAMRQLNGDPHRAQEVAQLVFTDLARKAPTLVGRPTLAGWLHTSTRFAAAKLRRTEFNRHKRTEAAGIMHTLTETEAIEWERMRPLIDDVIHELSDADREAVLLRFFSNRPYAEIGATFRWSEDAARMRVERALDKMRTALARRGVASTSGALAVAFAHQAGAAVPAALSAHVTAHALAAAAAGTSTGGSGLLAVFGASKALWMAATVVVLAGAGALTRQRTATAQPPDVTPTQAPTVLDAHTTPPALSQSAPQANQLSVSIDGARRTEWTSAAQLTAAGQATPSAALETLMLAVVNNDVESFAQLVELGSKMRAGAEQQWARLPSDGQAKFQSAEKVHALLMVAQVAEFVPRTQAVRIVEERVEREDAVILRVQLQDSEARLHEQQLLFVRSSGGAWRFKLPER